MAPVAFARVEHWQRSATAGASPVQPQDAATQPMVTQKVVRARCDDVAAQFASHLVKLIRNRRLPALRSRLDQNLNLCKGCLA